MKVPTDRKYRAKREWYLRNREQVLARHRQSWLSGKWKHLLKRQYPGQCELCEAKVKLLHYHHWDDAHPEVGVWLCPQCHRYAEGFDKAIDNERLLDKYQLLVQDIRLKDNQSHLI